MLLFCGVFLFLKRLTLVWPMVRGEAVVEAGDVALCCCERDTLREGVD